MESVETRTTLVVLYGGQSAEHDVSCITAAHVLRAIDHSAYRTIPVAVTREGIWSLPEMALLPRGGVDPEQVPDQLAATGEPTTTAIIKELASHTTTVVLPLIHGPLGEDGTIQGLLELLDLPYVGSGVLASAVAMDKGVSKSIFARAGIPQVRHLTFREDEIDDVALDYAAATLGFPMFIKPANMGSSVGVSKVQNDDELRTACALATRYDQWVICEEAVSAREIEVAIIGNRSPQASVVGEIIPGNEFYDYEDKYVTDAATLNIPAPLTNEQSEEVRALALKAYDALHCEGMARVDFFFEENGRGFLCNEINTIPGFTPISMYPKLWAASGLPYSELIDRLIQHAIERHARRKRNTAR